MVIKLHLHIAGCLDFLCLMSATERLGWLVNELWLGRFAFVPFSFNTSTRREKVKFTLSKSYDNSGVYRPCVLAALSAVQCAFERSIVTDKGHTSK